MIRRLRSFAVFAASSFCGVALAFAAPPVPKPAPSVAKSAAKPPPKTSKKSTPPPLPSPSVSLRLEPRAQNGWLLSISNDGDVPLQIVADARLLGFEVVPPAEAEGVQDVKAKSAKKKKETSLECALPASMRTDERTLVLTPGRRYLEAIDPRLYCLDASKRIVAGSTVVARLGWPSKKASSTKPPFIVRGVASAANELAALKEIVAEPVVVTPKTVPQIPAATAGSAKGALVAHSGGAESVLRAVGAHVSIHVQNVSTQPVRVYARPQLVAAIVRSPRGVVTKCDGWARPAPIVDFIVRLKPEAKWSATVLLSSICPEGTFDVPGLYEVTPRLHADAVPWDPKAVVGEIIAETPQLVRIEEGEKPYHDVAPLALDTSE